MLQGGGVFLAPILQRFLAVSGNLFCSYWSGETGYKNNHSRCKTHVWNFLVEASDGILPSAIPRSGGSYPINPSPHTLLDSKCWNCSVMLSGITYRLTVIYFFRSSWGILLRVRHGSIHPLTCLRILSPFTNTRNAKCLWSWQHWWPPFPAWIQLVLCAPHRPAYAILLQDGWHDVFVTQQLWNSRRVLFLALQRMNWSCVVGTLHLFSFLQLSLGSPNRITMCYCVVS